MIGKSVFITGCDSGFGELMALHYSREGAHVFAGVLTAEKGKALESRAKEGNITAIVLDVTQPQQFREAFSRVQSKLNGSPLDAIICNAGIGKGWLVELTEDEDYRQVMDVNFMGCIRTIRTFLPLIRAPGGRVIGITSVASFTTPWGGSCYACSKYAQGALLDVLRGELFRTGIRVIQIRPGFYNTPLVQSYVHEVTFEERYRQAPEDTKIRYADLLRKERNRKASTVKWAKDPMDVVAAVRGALLDRWPGARILVGVDAYIFWLLSFLPSFLIDRLLMI